MDDAAGDYQALLVRLGPAQDGRWTLTVETNSGSRAMRLHPATLIVRFWRARHSRTLRMQLWNERDGQWAPMLQTSEDLVHALKNWLLIEE